MKATIGRVMIGCAKVAVLAVAWSCAAGWLVRSALRGPRRAVHTTVTAGTHHRHRDAIRFMVKLMLLEIWKAWRAFEGLPVRESYHEERRGFAHKKEAA